LAPRSLTPTQKLTRLAGYDAEEPIPDLIVDHTQKLMLLVLRCIPESQKWLTQVGIQQSPFGNAQGLDIT
jgi:hypothetical protein